MDQIIANFIEKIDIQTFVYLFIFYLLIKKETSVIKKELNEIDKRLCRLEGAFSSKDCCMIKDDRKLSKAE